MPTHSPADANSSVERGLLRTLVDNSPDLVYAKNKQGRFIFANIAIAKMMRVDSPDDLLGKSDFDFYPKEMAQRFFDDERRVMDSGQALTDHEEQVTDPKTGEMRWHLTSKVPLRDEAGTVIGIVGITRDITRRRRAEAEVRELNTQLEQRVAERAAELAAERNLMRQLVDAMPDNIFAKDAQSRFLLANKSVADVMGSTPKQLLGKSDFDFYPKEMAQAFFDDEQKIIKSGRALIDREEPAADKKTGEMRWLLTTKIPLRDSDGNIIGLVGISRNITKRRQAELALRDSEERFRSLTELSSDWYWEKDEQLRLIYISDAAYTKLNYTPQEALGKMLWELPGLVPTIGSWAEHQAALAARKPFREFEVKRVTEDGKVRYFSTSGMPIFAEDGSFRGYRGVGRDITERKRSEERIQYLATHDSLTSLPNRVMFSEMLNHAIHAAKRYKRNLAVLFIDLDRFKLINDTLGHEAGDLLLKEMAQRLSKTLRASDVVARLGGDEFVVLLQEMQDDKQAATVARKLLSAVVKPMTLFGQECRVTASVGICMYPAGGEDEPALMKNADIAMYRAKEEGKNNYQFYSENIKAQSLERLTLENSLRRALEHNEFFLHYQAKLDVKSGAITGVEALLRWQHPDLGLVAPAQFIPLAEETGLIVPIGRWVLKTACSQNMAWQRQGLPPLTMAVNLSARQFMDEELIDDVRNALKESGMPANLLELELTESMVMQEPERAIRTLTAIKKMGARLAIDDFGTGYSSLAQIKQFPIDTLKVDRSFIRQVPQDSDDNAIAEAIIAMGKTLSLTIVAEGVETKEQEKFLREHACDEMQGYYFSRPIAADDFASLLRQHVPKRPK